MAELGASFVVLPTIGRSTFWSLLCHSVTGAYPCTGARGYPAPAILLANLTLEGRTASPSGHTCKVMLSTQALLPFVSNKAPLLQCLLLYVHLFPPSLVYQLLKTQHK